MIVGIVGSEKAKFTPQGEIAAKALIHSILSDPSITEVVSGRCHLGGIDIWAEEIGAELGLVVTIFPPKSRSWENGYKPRNLQIAARSDIIHCITVERLPENFTGMKFDYCYHCHTTEHVKSGGCWTAKQAQRMGKLAKWHVIHNFPQAAPISA